MSVEMTRPNLEHVHTSLKGFQKKTVDYIFQRMYLDQRPARRFLCADEVGLGKTMVAKGLIARTIEHLWDKVKRIDVVYICSNAEIARQNVNRLNISEQQNFALASRITLLPTKIQNLRGNRLNFVSFTPGTSFEMKSSMGKGSERVLLYFLLKRSWGLQGAAPRNILRGNKTADSFNYEINEFNEKTIDESIAADFHDALRNRNDLKGVWDELCEAFVRSDSRVTDERWQKRARLIAQLRDQLARTCLKALEPDLIILDEFQRFKNLLNGEGEAADLAKSLFEFQSAEDSTRVLLLSATPYKMYTMAHESVDDDHYQDFMGTLRFLQNDACRTDSTEALLTEYRRMMTHLDTVSLSELEAAKKNLESALRSVMVRTEKLGSSEDRGGMLQEIPSRSSEILHAKDIRVFLGMQDLAGKLGHPDIIEYWKSAPYFLNFMDDYKFKEQFQDAAQRKKECEEIAEILDPQHSGLLPWDRVEDYLEIDLANPRLRDLVRQTLDVGTWKTLWLPSVAPYYSLGEPFASVAKSGFTKRLVFSSWKMVPKAVASLLSYEAERRIFKEEDRSAKNSPEERKRWRSLVRFAKSEDRLTGMPILSLIYPSTTLSRTCDPLIISAGMQQMPSYEAVQQGAMQKITALMTHLHPFALKEGPVDERWYWVAPVLLDCILDKESTEAWFDADNIESIWMGNLRQEGEEQGPWMEHVGELKKIVAGTLRQFGPMPEDLVGFLAQLGIAGLGNTALRTMQRYAIKEEDIDLRIRDQAAGLAYEILHLFGHPEAMAILRGIDKAEPYWRRVLEYCCAGCFQAVLDEYAHTLIESLGLTNRSSAEVLDELATAMGAASSLRTSSLRVDQIQVKRSRGIEFEERSLRMRYAMRFGDELGKDNDDGTRSENVKAAFNSPFWPFVLISTSVGQEGLDFHTYCHAITHWNLPANPLDLEQREGRVHRYKGHAIRKNVALRYGGRVFDPNITEPWTHLFQIAKQDAADPSEIVPFWVYPVEGGARIERHVPALPLSRDSQRLVDLRKTLAAYRMVFGHARQDDLLKHLLGHSANPEIQTKLQTVSINLAPQ
jgi:hypothetical protein